MRILFDGQQLSMVVADTDIKGMKYVVGDDIDRKRIINCQEIVVTMEHGNNAMIPFAICVLLDGRMRLVNLPLAKEVELKDNVDDLPTEAPTGLITQPSGIIQPN